MCRPDRAVTSSVWPVPPVNINTQHPAQLHTVMGDSDMSPKARVTYDQHKFEVEFNVSEYLPEVSQYTFFAAVWPWPRNVGILHETCLMTL